jgi:type I restriction enzyme R subunit
MQRISANFDFLGKRDAQLVRLGALAERYFKDDPNTCLIKLRQFGEVLAQLTAAKSGLFSSPEEQQTELLRRLRFERVLPEQPADFFHQIRLVGNRVLEAVGEGTKMADHLSPVFRPAFPSSAIISERSSPSRVRFAAPNNGAPLTAPGRSGQHF